MLELESFEEAGFNFCGGIKTSVANSELGPFASPTHLFL